jgi:ankyrin repeat protein
MLISYFLANGAEVDARDKLLKTPLHYACENGYFDAVKCLLDAGADAMEVDNCGRTALHYSIYSAQTNIITMLLNQNRELIGIKDNAGRTPLHHTVFMEAN